MTKEIAFYTPGSLQNGHRVARFNVHFREDFSLAGVAFGPAFTRAQYVFADHGRLLGGSVAAQFLVFHRGYFDLNVDAVDQRLGYF